jgi:hypothetical protein
MAGECGRFLVDLSTHTEEAETICWRVIEARTLVVVKVVYNQLTTVTPGWANDVAGQSKLPDPVLDLRG